MSFLVNTRTIVFLIGVALLAVLFVLFISTSDYSRPAQAQSYPADLEGWAWSSTQEGGTGWISFSCLNTGSCAQSNYKVTIQAPPPPGDPNEGLANLTGYAWNSSDSPATTGTEGIGWIDFDPSGPYPCSPQPTCTPSPNYSALLDTNTNQLSGWARVLAHDNSWSGWVKLRGTTQSGQSYGVSLNPSTGKLSGMAFGDVVTGWIKFNGTTQAGDPYDVIVGPGGSWVNISAVPSNVITGDTTDLQYARSDASVTGCVIDNGIGPVPDSPLNDSVSTPPLTSPGTVTYTIMCSGGAAATDSAVVTVSDASVNFGGGGTLYVTDVTEEKSVTLSWISTGITNLVASDGTFEWRTKPNSDGTKSVPSGSQTVSGLTRSGSPYTFTLTGDSLPPQSVTVIIKQRPTGTFTASPSTVTRPGDPTNLITDVRGVDVSGDCTITDSDGATVAIYTPAADGTVSASEPVTVTSSETYTLTCDGLDEPLVTSVNVSVGRGTIIEP